LQFFLLWFLTVFIFFTVSDTKLDLYLLPLLPTLALLVANYLDDLESRMISSSAVFIWLTGIFFSLVALAGLMLPIGAWIARPAAFWPILPSSVVLAVGGSVTISLLRRRRPLAAAVSVSAMMMLAIIAAALWLFPYLEQFKSHRQFSSEIKRIVPSTAPLYVYADSMNDFNFYTEREEIPVLSTAAQIETLRAGPEKSYLLVKERDLRRLPELPRAWFIASRSVGSTKWNLLEISSQPTK
jgi:4-amino-4-deoxy-L-arabinose transferase-like glycosyltransferase